MTPWTAARQAPLSMEFSRQEYCNGLPFPSPGNLPTRGIEPSSPALAGEFFTINTTWDLIRYHIYTYVYVHIYMYIYMCVLGLSCIREIVALGLSGCGSRA